MKIAILGAGPAGIEAALLAGAAGHEFTVYEGREVGASLLEWGPTRFFSPLGMNLSSRAIAALGAPGLDLDALLTGPEFVERILRPLAHSGALAGRIRDRTRVLGIARRQMLRRDFAGHPLRGEQPFVLHLEGPALREEYVEADAVIDATGVQSSPSPLGPSGLRALGEAVLSNRIIRTFGGLHRDQLSGRDVLLVGHAHSAATALEMLASLPKETSLTWVIRSAARRPVVSIPKDPLPERARIVGNANRLAEKPPANLHVCRKTHVLSLETRGARVAVRLSNGQERIVDAIVSMTGYRGDYSFLSELALDLAPGTEGPARLARAIGGVKDCLSRPALRDEDLETGEPGFYFAGHKGYGRLSSFLLANGVDQLERVFALIERSRE